MSDNRGSRWRFIKIMGAATVALALGHRMLLSEYAHAAVFPLQPPRQPEPEPPQGESPPKTGKAKHRILCLNGAATLAYFEVSSLIDLCGEKTRGRDVLKQFKGGIYAVSSGGLLLSGLLANYELGEIRDMIADPSFLKLVYPPKPADPGKSRLVDLPCYDTEKKTGNFWKAIGGTVDPDDPAARNVPALADGKKKELPGLSFSQIPAATGLDIKITYICQDASDKKPVLVRSWECKEKEVKLFDGKTAHQISGGDVAFADVVSASANPNGGILFDKPVMLNGRACNDGGATGHNDPASIAVSEALQSGVPADEIAVLSLGIGPRQVDYWSPGAPATLLQKIYYIGQNHLHKRIPSWGYSLARLYYEYKMSNWQRESFAKAFAMLDEAGASQPQLYRLAPSLEEVYRQKKFRYLPSDAQKPEEIDIMKKAHLDWTKGKLPNQHYTFVDRNGSPRVIGHKLYSRALEAVRNVFASPDAPLTPRHPKDRFSRRAFLRSVFVPGHT